MPRIGASIRGGAYDDSDLLTRLTALEAGGAGGRLESGASEELQVASGGVGTLTALGAAIPPGAVGVTGTVTSGVLCAAFTVPPESGDHIAFSAGSTPETPGMAASELQRLQLRVFYDATVALTYWRYA